MKPIIIPDVRLKLSSNYRPELNVIHFISTRRGDPERGPMVRMRSSEARLRLIQEGELVWVSGPRRQDLAVLEIDDGIPEGNVVLRDISGVTITEAVMVAKPDMDSPPGRYVG